MAVLEDILQGVNVVGDEIQHGIEGIRKELRLMRMVLSDYTKRMMKLERENRNPVGILGPQEVEKEGEGSGELSGVKMTEQMDVDGEKGENEDGEMESVGGSGAKGV